MTSRKFSSLLARGVGGGVRGGGGGWSGVV